jgi:hypothetical protein
MKNGLRLVLALIVAHVALAQPADPKFDAIKAKRERGEQLTREEREYGQSVLAQRKQKQKQGRGGNEELAKQNPPRESTGFVPLSDLGTRKYHGEPGGLYPDGGNMPPRAHAEAGLNLAASVHPLDRNGRPDSAGKIVLLSVGMSNTTQEFQAFQKLAATDATLNPQLVIVDGAQGGQTASVTAQSDANYWKVNMDRLKTAGVTPAQVQVAWIKEANARPTEPFPVEAKKLQADLVQTLHHLRAKFPNLKIAYVSSRTYGGYATTSLNPEPHAYESGFAVKWLIADQIGGSPELNYDASKGAVHAPWIAWGPYLWADGTKGRADGLRWERDNFRGDGTHPSESGQRKVAEALLKFFKTEPTARDWFLQKP